MGADPTSNDTSAAETRTIVNAPARPRRPALVERGTSIGRYLVIDLLGEGGMGVVVRAYDPKLHREVALKRLHRDALDSDAEARLLREAQAMAQLSHPNVITIHDVERTADGVVMAMELVEGPTLLQWLRAESRPWPQVLERFEQAGQGLAAAHRAGLVHRDFKPSNVLIGPDGLVKVMDFGLARAEPLGGEAGRVTSTEDEPWTASGTGERAREADAWMESGSSGSLSMQLTQAGAVMGTPAYMAPEQHRGEVADTRSDQYAFCVALWEALWERPFEGELRGMALAKHEGPPSPPRGTKVPRAIQDALRRGLAPVIEDRWPSMAALLGALAYDPAAKRRRWQRTGFVMVAGGAVAGALAVGQLDASSPCEDASAQMVGVWDEDTRAEVEAALEGTGLSYARTTWERVGRHLDEYAVRWVEMHREACEATAVNKVQSEALLDRRMQCLRRHRLRMAATVEVLRTADAEVVASAIEQVMALPSIERCADTEALLAEVPPPEDPAVAEAVRTIRDELTRAEALTKAGRYDDSQAQIEALLERARALEYGPLEAELLGLSARLADEQGNFELARDRGTRSYELALASGAMSVAAEAAVNLILVTGSRLAEPKVGRVWASSARALVQRPGSSERSSAVVLNAMGVLAYREGDFGAAAEMFERALPVMMEAMGEDNDGLATTLNNLGSILDEQSRYTEAEPHFRRALAIQTKVFGPDHPRTTMSMDNLALCLQGQGRNEESRQIHERTLEIRERALGLEHPSTGIAHNNLGWDLMGLSQPDAAAEHFARGLAIFEAAMGPEHPRVAMASESLALAELERGRYAESEALHRRALEIRRASLGEDHPNVALSLGGLGKLAYAQEQFEEAVRLHEQALAIIEAKSEGAERYLAEVLFELGRSLIEVERFAEARARLERALALREGGGTDPLVLGTARFALARAIAGEGSDIQAARAQAVQARQLLDGIEGEAARSVREPIDAWLASTPAGE